MKNWTLALLGLLLSPVLRAREVDLKAQFDSIENTLKYQRAGKVTLKDGIATVTIPKSFKYLDAAQARHVIVDLWGNPDGENVSMGMLLPEGYGVMDDNGYVFNIQYDEIGYVKDDDAEDIDYNELLTQMQTETNEENATRTQQGYPAIKLIGWASKPYYDANKKTLHWAKELQFGEDAAHTLNYNIRVLGRKGVLVLNAISTTKELALVKKDVPQMLQTVQFNDGYAYNDFNPSVDEVAAWTIGGLVAGKILTKVGFLAILAKFGKIIVVGVIGLFGLFRNKISALFGRKPEPVLESGPEPLEIAESQESKENE